MKYALIRLKAIGGPGMAGSNIEKMLERHAEFGYDIVKKNPVTYLHHATKNTLVHVQTTMPLLEKAVDKELPIIAGPNIPWKNAKSKVKKSKTIRRILTLRPDPAPRKCNPAWREKVSFFPPFVDETFFVPVNCKKTIDILTISKAFHYPGYAKNLNKLMLSLSKLRFKHVHLKNYNLEQFREKLAQTKVLAFPSPKESGVCCCHALLEANMMNVPYVILDNIVPKNRNSDEFHTCRGENVSAVEYMALILPKVVENYESYQPRSWVVDRYSFKPAYKRLCDILQLAGM